MKSRRRKARVTTAVSRQRGRPVAHRAGASARFCLFDISRCSRRFAADQSAVAIRRAGSPTCRRHPGPGAGTIAACPGTRPPAVVRYRQSLVNDRIVSGPRETICREKDDELRCGWAHATPRRGQLVEIGGILAAREVREIFILRKLLSSCCFS